MLTPRPRSLPCDKHLSAQKELRHLLHQQTPPQPLLPPWSPEVWAEGAEVIKESWLSGMTGPPVRRAKCSHWLEANKDIFSIYVLKEEATLGTR